ncbi:MAG: pyridoxal phosphate-dependent aminotransferase [Deltaproteobacteria bacterium]|nr:pyridoxal phosphate-dependent aminotransferase [Deltaproteobacteria bacterium]MBW2071192.1 pyridoxal phosphate-dependent aminotransferase [Deltaproteobacteria bacterium]
MAVARRIQEAIERSSWIRKMFEEGARLKAVHGADNVFDFSLGNPDVDPPAAFRHTLTRVAAEERPGVHGYMPNAGFEETRSAVAAQVGQEQGVSLESRHVVMTCGAAGGLNCIFKALLDPGDEVVVPAPYFVEYGFYAENHGGRLSVVPTRDDFTLDLGAIEAAINQNTKAVLLNSPNNPTGQVYDASSLNRLGELLEQQSGKLGKTLFLISDEPYRKLVYDGDTVPSVFKAYRNTIITSSYSKDISLPGERIGYLAVHPEADQVTLLMDALVLANRVLGFVNAPAFMQRVVRDLQGSCVDVNLYQTRRDLFCRGLTEAGYEMITPRGAFYLFPRSPIADDVEFVRMLQEENILVVPGSGFGKPGHFRISYCVSEKTISRSLPGFARARSRALS